MLSLEINRLGASHPLEDPVRTADLLEQWQVGVIPNRKYKHAGALRNGDAVPLCGEGRDQSRILNWPLSGPSVGKQDDIRILARLSQRALQNRSHTGAAAEPALLHKCESPLDLIRRCRLNRTGEKGYFGIENNYIESILRSKRSEHAFERLKAAVELVPLHRQR